MIPWGDVSSINDGRRALCLIRRLIIFLFSRTTNSYLMFVQVTTLIKDVHSGGFYGVEGFELCLLTTLYTLFLLIRIHKYCCSCMTHHFHKLHLDLFHCSCTIHWASPHSPAMLPFAFFCHSVNQYIKVCHKMELCHVRIDPVPAGH